MNEPLLSICIFTYNRDETIYALVNNLLKMTNDDIEIVVLDNASTDKTQEMLSTIRNVKFHWYRCRERICFTPGLIEAVRLGRGKFCLMLQDDSELAEFSWDKIYVALHTEDDIAWFDCEIQDKTGRPLMRHLEGSCEKNTIEAYKTCMNHGYAKGIVYRRDILEKAYVLADRSDYLYSVYAHIYIAMLAAQYGAVRSLPGLIVRQRKIVKMMKDGEIIVRYGSGKEPYWTAASRLEQKMGYVKVAKLLPLNMSEKISFLGQIFLGHLRFLVDYHDTIFPHDSLPIGEFRRDPDVLLKEQNRSIGEYHNMFWRHVTMLNKAILSYHRGLYFLNEYFSLDVNKIYDEFTKRLGFAERRHSGTKPREILLSVCVPTYNRGKTVEACVKKWLEIPFNDMEVVVSDNGSPDDTQERIEAIRDFRLVYHRHSFNVGFAINFSYVLSCARGKWLLLISDEDDPRCVDWYKFRTKLLNLKDTAVIRFPAEGFFSSHPFHYDHDTFKAYWFVFNACYYASGTMFNRDILAKCFIKIRRNTMAWGSYPHKVMALHCSKYGDVLCMDDLKIMHPRREVQDTSESYIFVYKHGDDIYQPEGRLQQVMSFMDVTVELATAAKVKSECIDYYILNILSQVPYYYEKFIKPLDKTKKYPEKLTRYINKSASDWKRLFFQYYRIIVRHAREVRYNNGELSNTFDKERARAVYDKLKKALGE